MDEPERNEHMRALAARIRTHLIKKGWTQARLEEEAYFPQGALSRIMSGRQTKVWPKTMHRIAKALGVPPEELAEGAAPSDLAHTPEINTDAAPPALEDIPGYANAELQVGRLAPHIPLEVFEEARKTRFASPPPTVTVPFLHAHVAFLAEHAFGFTKTSGTRVKPSARDEIPKAAKRTVRSKGAKS